MPDNSRDIVQGQTCSNSRVAKCVVSCVLHVVSFALCIVCCVLRIDAYCVFRCNVV